jgi:hypothetical protein
VSVRYRSVISILKNPFYAGVYVYGKSEKRTEIVDGRARKSYGHSKPIGTWEVLLQDHHEGYIDWSEFERNQCHISLNAFERKAASSLDVAVARCSRACSPAVDAEGVWALFIRGGLRVILITAANVSTRCWASHDA